MNPIGTATETLPSLGNAQDAARLREAGQKLEANFIAEMLKSAKFGERSGPFSGGAGEAQFSSHLRQAQADQLAKNGGIGLAEVFVQALLDKQET